MIKIIIILFLAIIIMPTARALDYSSSSIVIDKNVSNEIIIKNSRFITFLFKVENKNEIENYNFSEEDMKILKDYFER